VGKKLQVIPEKADVVLYTSPPGRRWSAWLQL
jgi:hypothetical protein